MRRLLILGSTGSIGTQALDIVRANPDRFEVVGLAAGGGNPELFGKQHREFPQAHAAVGIEQTLELIGSTKADVILNGITGSVGLEPTLAALGTGATLALANKESLIAGGPLVKNAAKPGQIVPVDSEHSALAQCLRSGGSSEVAKLVVTASGGPFRGRTRAELDNVTPQQAYAHPTWSMGPVVTINSATLVNKGLEVIEAHLLFDIPYGQIETVVHPQSIVHSMVTFTDGSTIAQASPPDMRLPIALALNWPDRVPEAAKPCDFTQAQSWTFKPVDHLTFPAIELARQAGERGRVRPAIYNAANEEVVPAFVTCRTSSLGASDTLRRILDVSPDEYSADPTTVDDVAEAERWARTSALEKVQ